MQLFNRVLVTGGAGFIGNRLVERLVRAGTQVAVIDNLFSGMAMPCAARYHHPFPPHLVRLQPWRRVFAPSAQLPVCVFDTAFY